MGTQVYLHVMQQAPAFITGRLRDLNEEVCRRLRQGTGPGLSLPVVSVLLQFSEAIWLDKSTI